MLIIEKRFVTFYSTTAAMSLFLNIIIHPYDTQLQCDLEILMSLANAIRSMPRASLPEDDMCHSEEICIFIMKLVWLGTCAVSGPWKMKRQT